jgi:integrase/recombinase XerC/integrase/recombinase XerD
MSEQETIHKYVTLSQIDDLRDSAHEREQRYDTALRDELIVVLLADFGLRAGELVQLNKENFILEQGDLMLPASVQKDYPVEDKSPSSVRLEIDPENHFNTERLIRTYFRELDSEWVFSSREDGHISEDTIRNVIRDLAVEAEVEPYTSDGGRVEPSKMHPHALRHSLASYMLRNEENRLVDVRNRLRHRSIQTTERVYEHFQRR